MPATIQTIHKPTRARGLDTSGNNNHAQIYSGRALEFDGVTDYFDVTEKSGVSSFANGEPWTWAAWVYFDDISDFQIFIGKAGATKPHLIMNSSKLSFRAINSGSNYYTFPNSTALNDGTWYRVVYVASANQTITLYVNGVQNGDPITTSTDVYTGSSNLFTTTEIKFTSWGGPYDLGSGRAYHMEGKMSDGQVWDTEWTADDAEYDYLNPEQLALNRGGTSLTNSNLTLWYPMNEGHRGNQSYVLDASNTGLGDNVALNGTFDTDLSQWTVLNNTGDNNVTWVDGKARLLYDPAIATSSLGISTSAHSPMTAGVNYKVTFDLVATSGELKFYDGASYTTGLGTGSHVVYFTAAAADIKFFRNSSGQATDVTIDNVKIYPINAKNNATTVFYGDDIVSANRATDSTFTASDGAVPSVGDGDDVHKWNPGSGTDISIVSNTLKVNNSGAAAGHAHYPFTTAKGRSYNVKITLKTESSDIAKVVIGGSSNGSSVTTQDTSIAADDIVNLTFLATASTTYVTLMNTGTSTNDNTTWDDFSIKEVGIASGWTDADQQLDIPQTALQSYNQFAYFDRRQSDFEIPDSDALSFTNDTTDSPMSISAWIYVNGTGGSYDGAHYIFHKGYYSSSRHQWEYSFEVKTDGKLKIAFFDGTTWAAGTANYNYLAGQQSDAVQIALGKWYHVAATYDGGDTPTDENDCKLYVNGEHIPHSSLSSNTYDHMNNTGASANIGMAGTSGSFGAEACQTGTALWSKELSEAEIQEVYNNGLELDCTTHSASANLVAYWRNNGLGQWDDLSSNSNHGTVVGNDVTETMLITAGADSSRDSQGFLMNRQRLTNSLNLNTNTIANGIDNGDRAIVSGGTNLGTADFSVSFWAYKFQDWKDQWVVSQYVDTNNRWYVRANESNPPRFHIFGKSGGNVIFNVTDSSTNLDSYLNTWVHVVCTVDRDGSVKIYFNGSEIKSAAVESGQHSTSLTFASNLIIGQNGDTSFDDHHFDGKIDDLLIYGDKLEAKEVTRIYNAGKRSHR
jgi:hypothetical protein